MSKSHHGRLTREKIGYSMPAMSPLFPKPPMPMDGVESMGINFVTDLDALLELVPEPLEIEEPAMASMGIGHVTGGGMGEYFDARLVIPCLYEGKKHRFDTMMIVSSDVAFALGRELHGAPKKMGHVVMTHEGDKVTGFAERPLGCRVMAVSVSLDEKIKPDPAAMNIAPSVSLRVIGQPTGIEPDPTIELIQTPATWEIVDQWTAGKGELTFPDSNGVDKWDYLPIKEIKSAFYTRLKIHLPIANLLTRM